MSDPYNLRLQGIKTLALALTRQDTRDLLSSAWNERQQADDCLTQKDDAGFINHLGNWIRQMHALQRRIRSLKPTSILESDWPQWLKNMPPSPRISGI